MLTPVEEARQMLSGAQSLTWWFSTFIVTAVVKSELSFRGFIQIPEQLRIRRWYPGLRW